jgi:hypothetical protein
VVRDGADQLSARVFDIVGVESTKEWVVAPSTFVDMVLKAATPRLQQMFLRSWERGRR